MPEVPEYIDCMKQLKLRLQHIDQLINFTSGEHSAFALESAASQLRKILEIIAFSSIAPCRWLYEKIRFEYDKSDYRDDWNARSILLTMDKIKPDFYPNPFKYSTGLVAERDGKRGRVISPIKNEDYLTRKRFEKLYTRVGKFLHADNPWRADKGLAHFRNDLPKIIAHIKQLLNYHFVQIKSDNSLKLWMVQMGTYDQNPQMLIAEAIDESAS
ncbi:hypothetical protein JAO78_011945 [Alishewanella sp. 16-MA]|uniref:Uncharacterized protein n=1 Tax=Alishewanella maricola TaxID=2795740 RepID=A0ABS8C5C8_9ALTE|nr:hypothetical protein [Alishewanella maricola]MCB5227523.1 hypothetical protein [Alishewanella maricola]